MNMKKNKKGFTLVEVIVVLVIVGLLMALAVPAVTKYINEASETKVASQVRAGYIGAQTYVTNYIGEHPGAEDETLAGLVDAENGPGNVNKELGFEGSEDDAMEELVCTVKNKKVVSCDIKVKGSETTYTATQTEIAPKKAENPGA